MIDVTFEESAWETVLSGLQTGGRLSATHFLALMERESEEAVEDALALLDQKDILLDISDLPSGTASGETAVRLRLEQQLIREGRLPEGLEENDPLRLFLEEIAKVDTTADLDALTKLCLDGDRTAQQELTDRMLPRVIELACDWAGHSVLLMDLIQEGSLGLWQAILSCSGGDFEAECDRCIHRALARAITLQARANGVGQKMRQAMEDYRAVDEHLLSELGRNPTLEEIAQELHMTQEEAQMVEQMLRSARNMSQAVPTPEPEEEEREEQMAVEDTAYFQMRQRISELLSVLSEEESKLLTLRFGLEGGLPLSPEETGRKLGLTAAEVVALEGAALAKLRKQ